MLKIRPAQAADRIAWDEYIDGNPDCSPYHLFAWGESVSIAYGHEQRYFLAESGDRITGVLPLIKLARPLLGDEVVSLPFCDIGGPLADSAEIAQALKTAACNSPDLDGTIEYREAAGSADISILENAKVRMLLPLPAASEVLFGQFKSKLRSQIRKASKNGLHFTLVCPCEEPDKLSAFYRVFSVNMHHLGSPVHGEFWFETLAERYGKRCLLSVVWLHDVPCAAGIILLAGGKASIPWASAIAEFNSLSPNMLLYWSLLEYCCDNGIGEFDFGRSSYGQGTYKFKTQWGAVPRPLNWHSETPEGICHQAAAGIGTSRIRVLAETIWRAMPLGLTVRIGPAIRKYISL